MSTLFLLIQIILIIMSFNILKEILHLNENQLILQNLLMIFNLYNGVLVSFDNQIYLLLIIFNDALKKVFHVVFHQKIFSFHVKFIHQVHL